jgi:hypothetical protein
MGKRKGRRTRSGEGGRRLKLDRGVRAEWPGLSGPSIFTPEGRIEQDRAVSLNLAHASGLRGATARVLWVARVLLLGPAALALVIVYAWRAIRRRPL